MRVKSILNFFLLNCIPNIKLEQTDREFVKPKTIQLVFAASLLSMKH